jgi:hypothetical protein
MKTQDQLYDVVIYEVATMKIDTIAGKDLSLFTGHYNAERRVETVEQRINERYSVGIIKAGTHVKGDVIKAEELIPT